MWKKFKAWCSKTWKAIKNFFLAPMERRKIIMEQLLKQRLTLEEREKSLEEREKLFYSQFKLLKQQGKNQVQQNNLEMQNPQSQLQNKELMQTNEQFNQQSNNKNVYQQNAQLGEITEEEGYDGESEGIDKELNSHKSSDQLLMEDLFKQQEVVKQQGAALMNKQNSFTGNQNTAGGSGGSLNTQKQ